MNVWFKKLYLYWLIRTNKRHFRFVLLDNYIEVNIDSIKEPKIIYYKDRNELRQLMSFVTQHKQHYLCHNLIHYNTIDIRKLDPNTKLDDIIKGVSDI